MNHSSINTSALFDIWMCCWSSMYGISLTRASMAILWSAINQLVFDTVAGLNAHAFTTERQFLRLAVHLAYFFDGFSVYWWGLRRSILVGTWWRLSNRTICAINSVGVSATARLSFLGFWFVGNRTPIHLVEKGCFFFCAYRLGTCSSFYCGWGYGGCHEYGSKWWGIYPYHIHQRYCLSLWFLWVYMVWNVHSLPDSELFYCWFFSSVRLLWLWGPCILSHCSPVKSACLPFFAFVLRMLFSVLGWYWQLHCWIQLNQWCDVWCWMPLWFIRVWSYSNFWRLWGYLERYHMAGWTIQCLRW